MPTETDLETRVSKLEKQGSAKFFVQYLLSPLLLLIFGAVLNARVERSREALEEAKADIQRLDLAQKMIPILFAGNPDQAFATQRLMEKVLDPEVAKDFREVITKYYSAKIESDVKKGDFQAAAATLTAAQNIGGQAAVQVEQSVQGAQKRTLQRYADKLHIASLKEREGFEDLLAGKYDEAIQAFQAAENAYNSYHQVYELARLLRSRRQELNDVNTKGKVLQLVVEKYSYGAPPDLIEKLKAMAGQ